ncbi:MAG TPA: helix-hairpin-helix domain-containing protein [Burkholderiaceae bacterium]
MNPQNRPIAEAFVQIANLLELQRADPVRVRAYRKASQAIGALPDSVRALVHQGRALDDVTALGEPLAGAAVELAETGSCALLQRLHAEIPPDFNELLELPGLGPQRVRTLHEELGVRTIRQLHDAAAAGRLQSLAGFGPRLEQQLLRATAASLSRVRRLRRDQARPVARAMSDWLLGIDGVRRVEVAGCLRRECESVGDVNLVAQCSDDRKIVSALCAHPEVREVPYAGRARAGVVLADGARVDLQVSGEAEFGAHWLARTGSAAHVRALSLRARHARLTLDETGLRRDGRQVDDGSEASIYRQLDLAFIPPELREDAGEIEAAAQGTLPALVRRDDLVGDLRVRTRVGAAETPLAAIVEDARARGLSYIAVADPARRLVSDRASDLDRLAAQIDEIDRLNEALAGRFVVLAGVHAGILEDGRLNVPDAILGRVDLVFASLEVALDLTRTRQTDRLLRALDNRFLSILAAPTGRRVEERRGAAFDLARVLRKARERGCFVELDGRPDRLDLDAAGCRLAGELGVLVAVDSCACDAAGFDALDDGVGQARRGGLEARQVLNTRPVEELRRLLAPTMSH